MPRTSKTAAAADKADEGQAGTAYGHTINGVAASSADLKFILALVGNLESKPEVNWEELAVSLGLKNKKVASERWRVIRNKFGILANQEVADGANRATAITFPNRVVIPKATNENGHIKEENEEEEAGDVTPAKKRGRKPATATTSTTPRSTIGKKRTAATVDPTIGNSPADDSEQQESPTKAKATGKAPAPAKFGIVKKEQGGGAPLGSLSSSSELSSVLDMPAPAKVVTVKKEKGGGAPLAPSSFSSELSSISSMTAPAKPVIVKKEKGGGVTLTAPPTSSKLPSVLGMTTDDAPADEMEE